jgi:hypothetical protein
LPRRVQDVRFEEMGLRRALESLPWTGVYVPALDTPLDMNGDGTYDVYITTDTDYSGDYKGIAMYISGAQGVEQLSDDPNNGYILTYTMAREWNDNMYLYPIPSQVILMNENLTRILDGKFHLLISRPQLE